MTICFTRSSNNILYLKKFFIKFKDVETIKEFAIAVSEYVFRAVLIDCYKHGKTIE